MSRGWQTDRRKDPVRSWNGRWWTWWRYWRCCRCSTPRGVRLCAFQAIGFNRRSRLQVHAVGLSRHDHMVDSVSQHHQRDLLAARIVDRGPQAGGVGLVLMVRQGARRAARQELAQPRVRTFGDRVRIMDKAKGDRIPTHPIGWSDGSY